MHHIYVVFNISKVNYALSTTIASEFAARKGAFAGNLDLSLRCSRASLSLSNLSLVMTTFDGEIPIGAVVPMTFSRCTRST